MIMLFLFFFFYVVMICFFFFFFFQAEDGIRDIGVTGVQTCALPISNAFLHFGMMHIFFNMYFFYSLGPVLEAMWGSARTLLVYLVAAVTGGCVRSEERRVGKECGGWWVPDELQKKEQCAVWWTDMSQ